MFDLHGDNITPGFLGVWSGLWSPSCVEVGVPAGFQLLLTTSVIMLIRSATPANVLAQKGWAEVVAHHSTSRQIPFEPVTSDSG